MSDASTIAAPAETRRETWHDGEKAIQQRIGVADKMDVVGRRVVRDHMPDQHRQFYAQLPFIVAGSVDHAGDAWATLLTGTPGFVASPTPQTLTLAMTPDETDPAHAGMGKGDSIGLLGIELHTRRRNRVNGFVTKAGNGVIDFAVDQSFGNCPRYIQLRDFTFARDASTPFDGKAETLDELDAAARETIATADTFVVASYAERDGHRQVDASHRGGKPGFVRVSADGTLTIPDFDGNLFFNTLGNILLNGRAGLTFADFESGDLLQMTGDAAVIFDGPEIAAFQGAERLWTFKPRRIVRRRGVLPLRFALREDGLSPNILMTGDWADAAQRLRAAKLATTWRPFAVTRIVDESSMVRSFHLEPKDGAGLIPHLAGQHLPIRVRLAGQDRPAIRTYTLSTAPSDGVYRISVKRDGLVSGHLHDWLRVGDIIEARAPAGEFTIDESAKRPAVLLAAGVGITPMIAMLRHVLYEGIRKQTIRPTVLVYAARLLAERAFDAELAELVEAGQGAIGIVRVLSEPGDARPKVDYDAAGRIDMALLSRVLPFGDHDFYLCGPAPFAQSLYDGLRGFDVPDEHIHAEAFGPSSLVRTGAVSADASRGPAASKSSVPVAFIESSKEARWQPGSGSLLDLAEARGLAPDYSCRSGSCGTCRTRLLVGKVAYVNDSVAPCGPDEVLICSAVPADGEASIQLAL